MRHARFLCANHWPGNVRELENAIEGIVALSVEGELDLSLLPKAAAATFGAEPAAAGGQATLKERLDAYERGLIVAALDQAGGNRTHAARALGLNRGTLHSKLDKYGLGTGGTEDEYPPEDQLLHGPRK